MAIQYIPRYNGGNKIHYKIQWWQYNTYHDIVVLILYTQRDSGGNAIHTGIQWLQYYTYYITMNLLPHVKCQLFSLVYNIFYVSTLNTIWMSRDLTHNTVMAIQYILTIQWWRYSSHQDVVLAVQCIPLYNDGNTIHTRIQWYQYNTYQDTMVSIQ